MSIRQPTRTTIALDPDVLDRAKEFGRDRGLSFREALNELVRAGLLAQSVAPPEKPFEIRPRRLNLMPGLSYDNLEELLEFGEGAQHR